MIFTSKLVSPFYYAIDIKDLNKRMHKYNRMYQEEEKETPISNKGKFYKNVLKKHKKLLESKRKDVIHVVILSDKEFSTRIQYLLKELQGKPKEESRYLTGKKDPDKSPSNHRKTVRTSKGKAPNIKNYGQTLVRDHSKIESVLQRVRFKEIEFTQALEH